MEELEVNIGDYVVLKNGKVVEIIADDMPTVPYEIIDHLATKEEILKAGLTPKNLKYRMYFFVPYNISPIQQAIQAGHCVEEYGDQFRHTSEYIQYRKHKTWVILNGGTTNDTLIQESNDGFNVVWSPAGTLNRIEVNLDLNKILYASFREPDLNNALTAVCFLADERVFDFETYPEFYDWVNKNLNPLAKYSIDFKNPALRRYTPEQFKENFPGLYKDWVKEVLGGEKNEFLRNLIRGKKLA
jgi:hypothetical protein